MPAAPLYGEQEREERVDVMRRLLDGRVRIAVTTEMGARGLDIPDLTHVVNLELPTDPSHYVHRAGRCGRAGVAGTVLSLVPPGKAFVVSKLTKALGVPLRDMRIKGGVIEVGKAEITSSTRGGAGSRGGGRLGPSKLAPAKRKKSASPSSAMPAEIKKKVKRGYPRLPVEAGGRGSGRGRSGRGWAAAGRRGPGPPPEE